MTSNMKLADERATVKARLADLHQGKLVFGVGKTAAIDCAGWQLPTFTNTGQNVAVAATLLDTLPIPSTNGVDEVY
jgi:hypothetical protein